MDPVTPEAGTAPARRWSRRRRILVIAAGVLVPILVFVVVWFEPQAALIDDEVDESLAGLDVDGPRTVETNSISAARARAASTGEPVVVSSAEFVSGEHDTSGTALVVALPGGDVVVRLEDLDTSNGPDLRVVVSPDPASDSWEYGGRKELDELKGNIGSQNYVVGTGIDLTSTGSVVIWCERFDVAFGAASIDVTA